MRCYFHLVSEHDAIRDDVGVEVTDLSMAELEALKAVQELRQEEDGSDDVWLTWQLNVTDEFGQLLLIIPLDHPEH
jgi:hypothetical protein